MRKNDVSKLLQRYLIAFEEGKEAYFDADEIDCLLDSFEEKDDYTHYEGVLSLGIRLHPMSNDLKIRKCKLYLIKGEYKDALLLADAIAETNDQDLDMIRLECYCSLNRYKEALAYVGILEEQDCEYLEDIYELISQLLSDLEMTEEAREVVNRGLALFPDNILLKEELCFLQELAGEYEQAIPLCNELIDQDPYSYDLWYMLGRLYSMEGNYEKAIEAFDFALACDDAEVELKILKAYCLFMNESYKKAIEVYTEIAMDEDSMDRVKHLIAECYVRMEEYEEAYQLLNDVITHQKEEDLEPATYINYVKCCVETGREREALKILRNASVFLPENEDVFSFFKPEKYIPLKDLTAEYLNNKDNNN